MRKKNTGKPTISHTQKKRLDARLVELGLAQSRARACALVLSGNVRVDDKVITKAGFPIGEKSNVEVIGNDNPYVSRGGVKLEGALDDFHINVTNKVGLDAGASTGGFTDCLLCKGIKKVYAVDVGYGQFDWTLRNDPRVTLFERKNIRKIKPDDLPEKIDIAVIDVSFISLRLVLPPVTSLLKKGGEVLALIKPQFEVGKGEVGKGGVVRDPEKRQHAVDEIVKFSEEKGFHVFGVKESKLQGPKGNIEYFLYATV